MIHISRVQIESGDLYLDLQDADSNELLRVIRNIAPHAEVLGLERIIVEEHGVTTMTRGLRNKGARRGRTSRPLPETAVSITAPSQADAKQLITSHKIQIVDSKPQYTMRFANQDNVLPFISAYMSALFVTFGSQEVHQNHLRIAIHEICANLVEHGQQRSHPSTIGIHLEFNDGSIKGWIEDNCESFDLLQAPAPSLKEKIAERHPRGYGITMIQQILDDTQYESGQTLNRFYFKKRMEK